MKQYVKIFPSGESKTTRFRPLFQQGERERAYAGENPDVLVDGKWWNSVNGGELIVNGTFDTDTSGWTAGALSGATSSVLSLDNGQLKVTNVGATYGYAYQAIPTIIGLAYTITFGRIAGTATASLVRFGSTAEGYDYFEGGSYNSNGESVSFVATSNSVYITLGNVNENGATSYFDNISVYETEIIPDTEYPTQFSYMAKDDKLATFLIEDGQPVDITYDYDSPSIVQNVIQAKDMVVVDKLKINNTEWLNDGVDYDDPDAIGANPVAKIYPDGTIVGSTDNGEYVKYPNGELECYNDLLPIIATNDFIYLPTAFVDTEYVALLSHSSAANIIITPQLGKTDNAFQVRVIDVDNIFVSTALAQYIAKGRWKA